MIMYVFCDTYRNALYEVILQYIYTQVDDITTAKAIDKCLNLVNIDYFLKLSALASQSRQHSLFHR